MSIGVVIVLCVALFITGVAAGYASGLQDKETLDDSKPMLMLSPGGEQYNDLLQRVFELEKNLYIGTYLYGQIDITGLAKRVEEIDTRLKKVEG